MPDFRVIPSIDQLRQRPRVVAFERDHGATATTSALRAAAAALRAALAATTAGQDVPADAEAAAAMVEADVEQRLAAQFRGSLRSVINATGVIIHTNLGRAPLSSTALQRIQQVARGYSNLEYDLAAGGRGSRTVHAETLLTALTGAEAALVVNNNAAATMLILAGLAAGREAIVSRGELVEIGGGFRVPDVMSQSGALLREVGTTNRTRIADYRAAIGPKTALLMRVHPSNFRIEGFTEQPTLASLVGAAHEAGVPFVEDLGSGCLLESMTWEPSVQASIAAGVDVVCFSGDKLLGGPQSGIIVGRRALLEQLARHPLMRAFRVDKLTLAALEGTLIDYLAGRAADAVPVPRMIAQTVDEIEARAEVLVDGLHAAGWTVSLQSGVSAIGGGSAPGVELPTVLVALEREGLSATALEKQLRALDPPVIARIEADRVVLDLRTVDTFDDLRLTDALKSLRAFG
ncbi:MAG TPA: L-seryl-tRNA(Sec) selenium transferase [Vicinamibacterales bacterium]|nr:L-seryl-tRNA(Sec) selenium transferase [Vicinamibacterales bacterium]